MQRIEIWDIKNKTLDPTGLFLYARQYTRRKGVTVQYTLLGKKYRINGNSSLRRELRRTDV